MKNSLDRCVLIGFVTNEFFMKINDYDTRGDPCIFNEKNFIVILSSKMAS